MDEPEKTPSLPAALPESSPLAPLAPSVERELAEIRKARLEDELRRRETPPAPAARVEFPTKARPVPTIGRIVLYRLPPRFEGDETLRAALVANAWPSSSCANLRVFLDPANDLQDGGRWLRKWAEKRGDVQVLGNELAVLSSSEGEEPGDWRWPARV